MYQEHDHYEPQIPSHISRICVASAHVYLMGGIIFLLFPNFLYKFFGANSIVLYTTSILHWRKPLFDSYIRYIDICLAVEMGFLITYVMYTISMTIFYTWICCYFFVIIMFVYNESLYYYQVKKPKLLLLNNPEYVYTIDEFHWTEMFSWKETWPQTKAREYVYYRSVLFHALFIHMLTGGTGSVIGLYLLVQ